MSTGDIYDPEARRVSPTLQRRWNRFMAEIDRDLAGDKADEPQATAAEIPPVPAPTPDALPHVKRLSAEDQDAYSDRMRARYGGEW